MKKVILLLFAFVLVTGVQAQTFRLGVKVGANYAGYAGKDSERDRIQHAWGVHGGLVGNIAITEDNFFSIQPEVLYSMKGAQSLNEVNVGGGKTDEEIEWDLHYIDIPVLARVQAGFIYFEAGPQLSALITANVESNRDGSEISEAFEKDLKNVAFGYAAGVGISSSSTGLSIGVRYNGDVTKLFDDSNRPNYRNSVFMISLGYMFGAKE